MLAFDNIRVIDLSHVIAGPFCTYQLAVMGAEVIKIEPLNNPDMVRADGAELSAAQAGMGSVFMAQNANKQSLPIDLKTTDGRDLLLKLVAQADVFVENYKPGAMEKLGLGYTDIKAVREDIIYCSLSGFGQQGPLAERTAYDNVIQAYSGLTAATGSEKSGPTKVGPPVLDYGTGIQAAFAIATALYQRTRSGEGRYIDIAMLDAALMLCSNTIMQVQSNGLAPPLPGNQSASNAAYGCYDTAEGQLMLGAYTAEQCYKAWTELGDAAHGEQLRELSVWQMADHVSRDRTRLAELLLSDTAASWEERFNRAGVPAARVRQLDETLQDPHLANRAVLQSNGGQIRYPTAAFSFNKAGPELSSEPPQHGAHSREILQSFDFTEDEIEQLINSGTISEQRVLPAETA